MNKSDKPALVGIVPRRNLWPIIQNERWYHVPVASAPRNVLGVKYVAFYFPDVFEKELRYQAIYYAPVLKIDTVKRIRLFPDQPRHPRRNKDYYQIHLGGIKELPRPIPSRRQRKKVIHVPTSLQRLFTAEEINDLYETSPLEEKMYKALKGRQIYPERQWYVWMGRWVWYCLDFCIFCHKDNIDLECDGERYHALPNALAKDRLRNNQLTSFGWRVLRFSGAQIHGGIGNCLDLIEKTIRTLKGLKD